YGQQNDYFGPRVRDPAGAPDGKIMFAGALSVCHWGSEKGGIRSNVKLTRQRLEGQPGGTCDMGVYVKQPGSNKASDGNHYDGVKTLVNTPNWHEYMPKPVVPYKAIYGVDEPR